VYTLGISRSGYAAIRFGLDLGAAGVLAFSPPVNITAEFMEVDGRASAHHLRLRTIDPDAVIDLKPLIERAAGRVPIHLWYGEDAAVDRRHAAHIDGLPGVTIRALPDVDRHNTFLTVLADGRLGEALDLLLGPA
jgi:hypothetical protein